MQIEKKLSKNCMGKLYIPIQHPENRHPIFKMEYNNIILGIMIVKIAIKSMFLILQYVQMAIIDRIIPPLNIKPDNI